MCKILTETRKVSNKFERAQFGDEGCWSKAWGGGGEAPLAVWKRTQYRGVCMGVPETATGGGGAVKGYLAAKEDADIVGITETS